MTKKSGQYNFEKAIVLITNNNLDEAYALLKEIIAENPKNEIAFNLLGAMHEKSGNIEDARFMYRVALTINPAYKPAQANLHRLTQLPPVLTGLDMGYQS
ncbi:hypothetical protein DCCM_0324 [Desulfocucumis palustris]|uniref:Uncharacterized protein n=1 Tax=Desulfocucumis palustris TaxID=1898651 RepID=A0A2L2X967_9FIRM|nr:tetratricopeptide repeat protein [Desulfocucumis palustris]GBF32133.1 hypothetical protein DCCM_0324 [Desulfocucumis palustris]